MFNLIFETFCEHPFIFILSLLLMGVLAFKFWIWFISYVVTEIICHIHLNLCEKYGLRLSFIEYIDKNIDNQDEADVETLEDNY